MKSILKIVKYLFINPIDIQITHPSQTNPEKINIELINTETEFSTLNAGLMNKIIYWVFDIEKDTYKLENYENVKINNFQENIKHMNAKIYDDIVALLHKKLHSLIKHHIPSLSLKNTELLIYLFKDKYGFDINQDNLREIIIKEYLQKIKSSESNLPVITEEVPMPSADAAPGQKIFRMRVNTMNPIRLTEHVTLEAYGRKQDKDDQKFLTSKLCKHKIEHREIEKLKQDDLNKYNMMLTEFIDKYMVETPELDYICKICGEVVPFMKKLVQDGKFDNVSQKFITAYTPTDIALENIKEYQKYHYMIKFMDNLIKRVSLMTGTNMLVGSSTQIVHKRKAIIKNVVDILVKHTTINLQKNISDDDRINMMAKKFNINKDLDSVFYFELEDRIVSPTPVGITENSDLNRHKLNNILLYFMLIFMVELNGSQISMMTPNKYANIYTLLKYGDKLFGDLLIKKNITDNDTVSILKYPVLCYIIFLMSYYFINYKLWFHPSVDTKSYNPAIQKVVIHSFVDLLNSIMIDAGKNRDDYVYMLTSSKFYTQLNETFKNETIINILKNNQSKFEFHGSNTPAKAETKPFVPQLILFPQKGKYVYGVRPIPSFKVSSGVAYINFDEVQYQITNGINDLAVCPSGDFHQLTIKNMKLICTKCGENLGDSEGSIDRFTECYNFRLKQMAKRRCMDGKIHDFISKDGVVVCSLCGITPDHAYTQKELNTLISNLNTSERANVTTQLHTDADFTEKITQTENSTQKLSDDLYTKCKKKYGNKIEGVYKKITADLMNQMESFIGGSNNLMPENKYPIYLQNDTYIITNSYNGTPFPDPIVFMESDNRVIFKENHPHFKTDVYYYIDHRAGQMDVYYDAITLELVGYKEKHKEYVNVANTNNYITVVSSVKNRFMRMGFASKYINISGNVYSTLTNLVREHILKTKSCIDKFISVLNKIKYYNDQTESVAPGFMTTKGHTLTKLVSKYGQINSKNPIKWPTDIFAEWQDLRDTFEYTPIDWKSTSVAASSTFVSYETIQFHNEASNVMFYYLVEEINKLFTQNPSKSMGEIISTMILNIIDYIYSLYDTEMFRNSMEYKRFQYILDGSEFLVDPLKKGQGLDQAPTHTETNAEIEELTTEPTEEEKDEMMDIQEESEALDVETEYYEDEGEDYAEGVEYEE